MPTAMELLNAMGEWIEWFARQPHVAKEDVVLRFGILGAAMIADKKRAHELAKKYDIPIVHESYDDLINDPALKCIYVPLPVSLHYEWALKALQAGKHVLLEKPSMANADEARGLFRHPMLRTSNAPILLEARHYQFHPAWQTFLSLFDPQDVEEANVISSLAAGLIPADDIRFKFETGGGTLMDLGTYNISALRAIFSAEPVSVTSASPAPSSNDPRCDVAMNATYDFPNGGVGKLSCDLGARVKYENGKSGWWAWLFKGRPDLTTNFPPWSTVKLREKHGVEDDMKVTTQKSIVMNSFMGRHIWHRIDIHTTTTYYGPEDCIIKSQTSTESKKSYVWPESHGGDVKGEDWWPSYRHMLEAFVDRVKGRTGSGVWVDGEDSIKQMEAIDRTYEKSGLGIRPTSKMLSSAK